MITCQDITFRYQAAETPLFDGLALTIDQPGFHALFGPSGVGKTTLARIISGDIDRFTGNVKNNTGRPCLYTYNRERLPGWSSVGRHLVKTTPPGREALREELIDHFHLTDLMGMRFAQLSIEGRVHRQVQLSGGIIAHRNEATRRRNEPLRALLDDPF